MRRWLTVLLAVATLPAQAQNLLLHAPFDGSPDAAFARGSAAAAGGLAPFVPGLRGEAVVLDTDCLLPMPGNFRVEAGTVAAWVRPHWDGGAPGPHYLFCLYGDTGLPRPWAVNRWTISFGGGRCDFSLFTEAEGETVSLVADIAGWQAGEWHHVAATWDGVNSGQADAQLRLYLDGQLSAQTEGRLITVGATGQVMAIGRDQDGSPDYGQADCDDLFIYGLALDPAEIAAGVAAARELPYQAEVLPTATREVAGWWDGSLPYRLRVALLEAEEARADVAIQCALRVGQDLCALGRPGVADERSLRVVEVATAPGGNEPLCVPLAARVEDGLVEWQAPGETAPGASRQFELYFQVLRYQYPQPLVAQLMGAMLPAGPQPPPLPDYATQTFGRGWDFDDGTFSGIDQWGNKPEFLRNRQVVDGVLSMDVTQDPWFIWGDMWGQVDTTHQRVAIDLDRFPILEMKVRQSVPQAKWQLYGRPGTSGDLLQYEFPVYGTGWQRVRIDLQQQARWHGVLSAFRIDPTQDVEAHVEVDWVRLLAVIPVSHGPLETLGAPTGEAAKLTLEVAQTTVSAGSEQDITATVTDADGRPVEGQPIRISLALGSGGGLAAAEWQASLELTAQARRGLTNSDGQLAVRYTASQSARPNADTLVAEAEFAAPVPARVTVSTRPGPPHHYRIDPTSVTLLCPREVPLQVSAQLVDEYDNRLPGERSLRWQTDAPGELTDSESRTNAQGLSRATWRGDESQRWVYAVRVEDGDGLRGQSAPICLLPGRPRSDPIVLGRNGYFRRGEKGPVWMPLGGFYANWVGLPEGGEEGRRLISFVDASEEQIVHWLDFLASQGVTAMRFMLRAHTPQGMEPMDVIGRVNRPLLARVLRYMDLARRHDIRFLLVIHEDYTKPAYYDRHALETFCLPQYEGGNLDRLPPHQRRFLRDRELIGDIREKYTDPDVVACQEQYTRELVGLLKDNPQLFAWEFENEMVDCPASWANHMAEVIREVDPVTPICASHGGGGLNTADPLWWTQQTDINFYTYHLYAHTTSTSPELDYGAAVDLLACYGRMAGVCMLGESAGDEFSYYPAERDAERRYLMRDIIWFSLVNGNPGCFFWNARGAEVEQFRLAQQITAGLNWAQWERERAEVGLVVTHPLDDDKYYRTPQGRADYAMMGRYAQHYLGEGVDFDMTMDADSHPQPASLQEFRPPPGRSRVRPSKGWQVRANVQRGGAAGLAYVRNFAGIRHWEEPGRANMFLRERAPAPLRLRLNLPLSEVAVTATDLDTGEARVLAVSGQAELDLGTSDHDWALAW